MSRDLPCKRRPSDVNPARVGRVRRCSAAPEPFPTSPAWGTTVLGASVPDAVPPTAGSGCSSFTLSTPTVSMPTARSVRTAKPELTTLLTAGAAVGRRRLLRDHKAGEQFLAGAFDGNPDTRRPMPGTPWRNSGPTPKASNNENRQRRLVRAELLGMAPMPDQYPDLPTPSRRRTAMKAAPTRLDHPVGSMSPERGAA